MFLYLDENCTGVLEKAELRKMFKIFAESEEEFNEYSLKLRDGDYLTYDSFMRLFVKE